MPEFVDIGGKLVRKADISYVSCVTKGIERRYKETWVTLKNGDKIRTPLTVEQVGERLNATSGT